MIATLFGFEKADREFGAACLINQMIGFVTLFVGSSMMNPSSLASTLRQDLSPGSPWCFEGSKQLRPFPHRKRKILRNNLINLKY